MVLILTPYRRNRIGGVWFSEITVDSQHHQIIHANALNSKK